MTDTPRRTQRQRVDESSRRLVEAAIALIAEKGYAATTAQEIGLRAGYSRGLVAVRYGTKESLIDNLLTSQYEGRLDPSNGSGGDGLERVLARIARIREFAEADPQLLRAMLVLNFEAAQADTLLRTRIRGWVDHYLDGIGAEIRMGQADGSINAAVDAAEEAREMLSTAIGFAYFWVIEPDQFDLVRQLAQWADRMDTRLRSPSDSAQRGDVGGG